MDIALAKGLSILDLLARAGGPVRLSTIAEELGLVKSGVHRVLTTLCELGYATLEPETRRYQATLKTWELGAVIIGAHPAKRAAAPYMQELHRQTHETVNLLVLDGDDVLYLDKILSPRPLRFTTQAGTRAPAPLTASGLVILAHEPGAKAIVDRVIKKEPRAKELDGRKVMREIASARERGYATSESRWTPGIMGIAAPILGKDGRAAAAIAISGPIERIGGARKVEIIDAVLGACARVAETSGRL
jgi:IclR family acetate operon transcriptional repressor